MLAYACLLHSQRIAHCGTNKRTNRSTCRGSKLQSLHPNAEQGTRSSIGTRSSMPAVVWKYSRCGAPTTTLSHNGVELRVFLVQKETPRCLRVVGLPCRTNEYLLRCIDSLLQRVLGTESSANKARVQCGLAPATSWFTTNSDPSVCEFPFNIIHYIFVFCSDPQLLKS